MSAFVQPDDCEWKVVARPLYPRIIGDFSFKVAQQVTGFESFDQRTEELEELRQGGRYRVARVSESGEVLAAGLIDYPEETTINALYAQALAQAVAKMSKCEPAGVMRVPER